MIKYLVVRINFFQNHFRRKEKKKKKELVAKKSNENKGKYRPSDGVKRIVHKNTTTNSYVIRVEQSGAESTK